MNKRTELITFSNLFAIVNTWSYTCIALSVEILSKVDDIYPFVISDVEEFVTSFVRLAQFEPVLDQKYDDDKTL